VHDLRRLSSLAKQTISTSIIIIGRIAVAKQITSWIDRKLDSLLSPFHGPNREKKKSIQR
jgi:hypothetical protein